MVRINYLTNFLTNEGILSSINIVINYGDRIEEDQKLVFRGGSFNYKGKRIVLVSLVVNFRTGINKTVTANKVIPLVN